MPLLTGSSLSTLVKSGLYTDEMLSETVLSLYRSLSENAEELKLMGIDISVATVAAGLSNYPAVQKSLLGAQSWETANLTGVKWGIGDRNSFITALSEAMSPFNDLLYMLLCSGTYSVSRFIKINGADGYENAVVPMLNSLKCTGLVSQERFTEQANKNKSTMIKNILNPVFKLLEKALNKPMDASTEVLPSFAYFVQSGEMSKCMESLLSPITSNPLVEVASFLKILDLESMNINVEELLTNGIGEMAAESGLQISDIDFKALSQCGSHNGLEFVSDKGRAYVEILRWIFDTLKLNKQSLPAIVKKLGVENSGISSETLGALLDKKTDDLVKTVIRIFETTELNSPEAMLYPEISKATVQFTPNLTEENYKKVLNEIDGLLDDFVKEGGSYKSVEALLSSAIYSGSNVSALLTGIYGALEKEGLTEIFQILGMDTSPKGVATSLKNEYPSVYNVLSNADSWSTVSEKSLSWGFGSGSRRGFQRALVVVLRPLEPLFKVLLAGEDAVILDSIPIKGADGYNTAVIPLLEALGCNQRSIKTYSQYKNDKSRDSLSDNILEPIFDLTDELFDKPVKTLTGILPNIVYFINSGSLERCISNLLIPVTSLTQKLSTVTDLEIDVAKLTKNIDTEKLIGDMFTSAGIKTAEFDMNAIAQIGTKTARTSKSTANGSYVEYSYIEADQTGVLMVLLRTLARTLKMPENSNLLVSSMGSGNAAFSTYSSSISEQFAQMTEDELIEWLYNLLFKERAQIEIVVNDDYSPTIIYKQPQKNYTFLYFLGGFALVAAVIGVIIFCNRKRLYY